VLAVDVRGAEDDLDVEIEFGSDIPAAQVHDLVERPPGVLGH
jgi:hypothetical protein